MLADYEKAVSRRVFSGWVICYHSDYFIVIINIYATHTGCCSSERSRVILIEAAAASMTACKQDFALSVSHDGIEEFVTVTDCDRNHSVCART